MKKKRYRITKIHFESTFLFQKDGWSIGPWHGWKPEPGREVFLYPHGSASHNRLQIGPILFYVNIFRTLKS